MSQRCQGSGAVPDFGNQISHSHVPTSRRFNLNTQRRRYWLPSERRWIRLTVSTRGIKTIDAHGIESVVARMRARGERI